MCAILFKLRCEFGRYGRRIVAERVDRVLTAVAWVAEKHYGDDTRIQFFRGSSGSEVDHIGALRYAAEHEFLIWTLCMLRSEVCDRVGAALFAGVAVQVRWVLPPC